MTFQSKVRILARPKVIRLLIKYLNIKAFLFSTFNMPKAGISPNNSSTINITQLPAVTL